MLTQTAVNSNFSWEVECIKGKFYLCVEHNDGDNPSNTTMIPMMAIVAALEDRIKSVEKAYDEGIVQ